NSMNAFLTLAQAIFHRAREQRVEDQKVRHGEPRVGSGPVFLMIRLVARTTHKNGDPMRIVHGRADVFRCGQENVVLDVEDARRLTCSLEILAELKELPRLAVCHRAVADALDQLINATDLAVEITAVL